MTTVLPPQSTEKPLEVSVGRREKGRFSTTPGRLRLLSIVSVGAIVILLLVSAGALSSRRGAAKSVSNDSGALVSDVQAMYKKLADADAAASQQLLDPTAASAELIGRYQRDMDEASQLLADITDKVKSDPKATAAIRVIAKRLPLYAARIEAGRAYTKQGLPLGAEFTRQGSKLMRTEILVETLRLYEVASDKLHGDYNRGTSASQMVWIVLIGVATLSVLVVTQLFTARRTNRVLNVGLVAATLIVAVLLAWTLVLFKNEQDALVTAQRNGSDAIQVLSSGNILALQAAANSNLAILERGTGQDYRDESERVLKKLCGGADGCDGGLLAYAHGIAARTGSESHISTIQDDAASVRALIDEVANKENTDRDAAVRLAVTDQARAARTLDDAIAAESEEAQLRFDAAAHDARSGFAVLAIALTLGLLLAAALVLVGLQPRIEEYR